jgi:Mg2+/Co2+ transporter CorC
VQDAFGSTEADIQRQPDGTALIDGLTAIDEVNDVFGLSLGDPNYETIAGYVLGRLERLAEVGDEIEAGPVRLRVESLDELRIARVRLIRQAASTASRQVGRSVGLKPTLHSTVSITCGIISRPGDLPQGRETDHALKTRPAA